MALHTQILNDVQLPNSYYRRVRKTFLDGKLVFRRKPRLKPVEDEIPVSNLPVYFSVQIDGRKKKEEKFVLEETLSQIHSGRENNDEVQSQFSDRLQYLNSYPIKPNSVCD